MVDENFVTGALANRFLKHPTRWFIDIYHQRARQMQVMLHDDEKDLKGYHEGTCDCRVVAQRCNNRIDTCLRIRKPGRIGRFISRIRGHSEETNSPFPQVGAGQFHTAPITDDTDLQFNLQNEEVQETPTINVTHNRDNKYEMQINNHKSVRQAKAQVDPALLRTKEAATPQAQMVFLDEPQPLPERDDPQAKYDHLKGEALVKLNVHTGGFREEVCHCCGCCCYPIRLHRMWHRPLLIPSGFAPSFQEGCQDCNSCVGACNFGALDENRKLEIDKCVGCGLCQKACPNDAVVMERATEPILQHIHRPAAHLFFITFMLYVNLLMGMKKLRLW